MGPNSLTSARIVVKAVLAMGKKATNLNYEKALQVCQELLIEQGEENLQLKYRHLELKKSLDMQNNYYRDKGVWEKADLNQNEPYCPVCFSKDLIVPLQKAWEGKDKDKTPWDCSDKKCNSLYNPWGYVEPKSQEPSLYRNTAIQWDERY